MFGLVKARILVSGNVQGVGYRAHVTQIARNNNVRGLIRNLDDGGVEIYCEANKQIFKKFLNLLKIEGVKGDYLSLNVESLQVFREGEDSFAPPWRDVRGFKVDYSDEDVPSATLERLELGTVVMSSLRRETSANFKDMAERYGTISKDLKVVKSTLSKDTILAFVESIGSLAEAVSKNNDILTAYISEQRKQK